MAQNKVFIEQYKLSDQPCTQRLAETLIAASYKGILQAYDWIDGNPIKLAGADITQKLKIRGFNEYEPWDPSIYYLPGDKVQFEGKTWEALNDLQAGTKPELGDNWVVVTVQKYWWPSDVNIMRIEYAVIKGKRINQWIHLAVPAENTQDMMNQDILSVSYTEAEKFLDGTPYVFYSYSNQDFGWLVGDLFAWSDEYFQGKLVKALADFAYREKTNSKIHISLNSLLSRQLETNSQIVDPFSSDVLENFKIDLRWTGNAFDTIRLLYADYSKPIRVADIPAKLFLKSIGSSGSGFKGFGNLTYAIEASILKPSLSDTIPKNAEIHKFESPSIAKKIAGNFTVNQSIFYPLDAFGNETMFAVEDNFGAYIMKAIQDWSFDEYNKPYQNDSLVAQISQAEVEERIISQPAPVLSLWENGVDYYTDDLVVYNNKPYRCLIDNKVPKPPTEATDYWQEAGDLNNYFMPQDLKAIRLHYNVFFNGKGQIQSRKLYAASIFAYWDVAGAYKSIMTVSAQTLQFILSNKGVGSNGGRLWDIIDKNKLTGYIGSSSRILSFNLK